MDCVFCTLIREDSARWVFRGPVVCAFAPLDALAPGHTLVIPRAHHADLFGTPADVLAETMTQVQRIAEAMRSVLGAGGVNILSASGPGSQQSVPHLHVHVVPRRPGDGFSTWPSGRSGQRVDGDPINRLAEAVADR
ncbi:HIT family protein [Streptomyces sp. NBC_00316]|uniref:HIT family protein n=1 Tax=Streptomyces sp. NBC_00316 TaxID=2975710 RepID=UPI002E28609F|nr:HIT family protein [Streptomyces sp. NBC_00316]